MTCQANIVIESYMQLIANIQKRLLFHIYKSNPHSGRLLYCLGGVDRSSRSS